MRELREEYGKYLDNYKETCCRLVPHGMNCNPDEELTRAMVEVRRVSDLSEAADVASRSITLWARRRDRRQLLDIT